jgi:predicted house-cleaning noncanonical NTP pyrophosphatase (MazG superfamily)
MRVRKLHNKLVRDNIPEYLQSKDIKCVTEIADDDRYFRLLMDKLEEESQEAGLALDDEALLKELADVESVIDGILIAKGMTRVQLKAVQDQKDAEKGTFTQKIFLVSTEEEEEQN